MGKIRSVFYFIHAAPRPSGGVPEMIKFGQVQAYDKTTGEATIVYMRPDACAKCGACGGGGKSRSIRLKADCAVGDWVKVELPDGRFLGATALAYALPLACFLLGLPLVYALERAGLDQRLFGQSSSPKSPIRE